MQNRGRSRAGNSSAGTWRQRIVVAVLSNIAHAKTSALGLKIGDAFFTW